ncbi:hypothetical protein N431DRAFT_245872 [Stipitochalara longipes BDJ]|nr:hypothetical protein N431DRAFT_245872 [Stipitochalara longipes BDJ]
MRSELSYHRPLPGAVTSRRTGATWRKSPRARKVLFPNGSPFFMICRSKKSTHSIAALLAIGNSSHTIRSARRSTSARPEKAEIFETRLEALSFTGMPNIECAVRPLSYSVTLKAVVPVMQAIRPWPRIRLQMALTKKVFPRPALLSRKKQPPLPIELPIRSKICRCSMFIM